MHTLHINWYVTPYRGDKFAAAVADIAKASIRYGAKSYAVKRSVEDRYKFTQEMTFSDKLDFTRYWNSEELIEFRSKCSSWYQVPIAYDWQEIVASGEIPQPAVAN